jgi:hypothetical protein
VDNYNRDPLSDKLRLFGTGFLGLLSSSEASLLGHHQSLSFLFGLVALVFVKHLLFLQGNSSKSVVFGSLGTTGGSASFLTLDSSQTVSFALSSAVGGESANLVPSHAEKSLHFLSNSTGVLSLTIPDPAVMSRLLSSIDPLSLSLGKALISFFP